MKKRVNKNKYKWEIYNMKKEEFIKYYASKNRTDSSGYRNNH